MNSCADSYQICMGISLGQKEELIRFFLDLDIIFKVTVVVDPLNFLLKMLF